MDRIGRYLAQARAETPITITLTCSRLENIESFMKFLRFIENATKEGSGCDLSAKTGGGEATSYIDGDGADAIKVEVVGYVEKT